MKEETNMKWTAEKIKVGSTTGDLKVSILVKETAANEFITGQQDFVDRFQKDLGKLEVSRSSYPPWLVYKLRIVDPDTMEVWKTDVSGNLKSLMYKIKRNAKNPTSQS